MSASGSGSTPTQAVSSRRLSGGIKNFIDGKAEVSVSESPLSYATKFDFRREDIRLIH
jgi:hypothetical protein